MRILVTGGAGFIGSNYVRHVLATTDDEVVVDDALTYAGNLSTLRDVDDDPRYTFVHGDICHPEPLEDAMAGVDAVVPVMVTRCTNNFGPYQYPEKAIPLFTTNLLDDKHIPLYGDGLNERDWLYVDDHCAAVQLVLHTGTPGEIYNIGAGNETPNRVLVDKLLALLGFRALTT